MGVAANVIQHLLRSSEGSLGVDDPLRLAYGFQVTGKLAAIPEVFQCSEES